MMKYPKTPNEIAEEMAGSGISDQSAKSDEVLLRRAIISELDATNLYEQMARETSNEKLKKVFLDVAKEEKVHVGEFEALLKDVDSEHEKSLKDGEKEVGDIE